MDPIRSRTRKVIRWRGFHYGANAAYLVTCVTASRQPLLATISEADGHRLTEPGRIVERLWRTDLRARFPGVLVAAFAVMPDHVHAVLVIESDDQPGARTLSRVVGAMKSIATVEINRARGTPGEPVWQARFHDRVIRDDDEFAAACWYVEDNPRRWLAARQGAVANAGHPPST